MAVGRQWLASDCLGPGRQHAGQEMLSKQIRRDAGSVTDGQQAEECSVYRPRSV